MKNKKTLLNNQKRIQFVKPLSAPELICFDFDGTLVDSMPFYENNAARIVCNYCKISETEVRKKFRITSGVPFLFQIKDMLPHESKDIRSKIVEEYEALHENSLMHAKLFPETQAVLKELKRNKYTIAVSSSSKRSEIFAYLVSANLINYIDHVVGSRPGLEKGKQHFDYLLKKEAIKPDSMWFIGDSLNDMRNAAQAGIFFIGRCGPMFGAEDFRVESSSGDVLQYQTVINLKELLFCLKKEGRQNT